jgi:hypothetical protein
MENVGLKESLELVKALELVGVKGLQIAKGGLNAEDIPLAIDLLKEVNVIIEGVKGVSDIGAEMKDLSQEELIQLGLALFGVYKKIAEASKEQA